MERLSELWTVGRPGRNARFQKVICIDSKLNVSTYFDLVDDEIVNVDFRDIEAFDANTALVLGIASPGYIFKTT